MKKIIITITLLTVWANVSGQQNEIIPDLSKCSDSTIWTLHNREIHIDKEVHLNGKPGNGILWINAPIFRNGKIELDIKGKNERGKSFVGLAFHGLNDSTYDAVYFRPFNFKNPERKVHSVQYISHPEYTWHKLRKNHPEKYENLVSPVPEPTDWFHVTIKIDYPNVKVFVNNSHESSLTIEQLSSRKEGWIGFWVGNNSEGFFKNIKIIPMN
ncbi:MAG: family 16 glycoside hydrolase [Bacteroidota bacterium]